MIKTSSNPGENVFEFLKRCKVEAYMKDQEIRARFNGIEVDVSPHSHVGDLYLIWNLKHELRSK